MSSAAIQTIGLVAIWAGVGFFLSWLFDKFPCSCGRERKPYFWVHHNKVWTMTFWAGWSSTFFLINLIAIHWTFSIVWALIATSEWRRIYFHEKDKLRSVIRGLGRVFVNQHGRLKVSTTDGN